MNGLIKITKVYGDGRKEVVCEDNNILTDGLGVGIVNLLTDDGSSKVEDHIVGYFQVGTSQHSLDDQSEQNRRFLSTLKNPLNSEDLYGKNSDVIVDTHTILQYHKTNFSQGYADPPGSNDAIFAFLPDSHSTNIIDGVVHFRLVLTEAMANDVGAPISEFGLFSRDAQGSIRGDQSILVAYKTFPIGEGITKTSEFSLVIDWQIKLVDETKTSETDPKPSPRSNVVFIMIDDVGVDQLGIYDEINPYALANTNFANASPFSKLDNVNGSSVYPHTPTLSAIAASGVTFYNCRSQPACTPTRATLLTGKYNFSTHNYLNTGAGFWGPGMGMVSDSLRRLRSGLKGLNSEYAFLQEDGEYETLTNAVTDSGERPNTIASQKVLTEYLHEPDMLYQTAMFGKWHLAQWEEKVVYCEEDKSPEHPAVYGDGWGHISDIGRWDHYVATWGNLNADTIPGYNYNTGGWYDRGGWPNYGGVASSGLDGKQMGYVNFFANHNGDVVTVSDAGYTTYAQAASGVDPRQGDHLNHTTDYIFSAASSYFNTAQEPFFMYISPNTPHTPYTEAPSGGVYTGSYKEENRLKTLYNNSTTHVDAVPGSDGAAVSATWITTNSNLENFDYVLSSFLDGLDESRKSNTVFIITSDNGSVLTDLDRRASFCSSVGLGDLTGSVNPYSSEGSAGFGATYDKMMNLGAYGSALDPPQYRRGGENDSAYGFKASLYDRGMLVPMIVSGGSNTAVSAGPHTSYEGRSTSALVDLVDILATVVDIGGGDLGSVPSDSISFYGVLTGEVDASSHARQYSFSEAYYPWGNSTGNTANYGTYTGTIGACLDPPIASNFAVGDPTVPRTRRAALTCRFEQEQLRGFIPPITQFTLNGTCVDLGIVANPGDVTWDPRDTIPEASAGVWRIIRPGSGRVLLPGSFSGNTAELDSLGKGRWYEELYHIQNQEFTGVDLYELDDLVPEEYKGQGANKITSNLIVSAVSAIGGNGVLNNTNYYWNLARMYEACHSSIAQFMSKRFDPADTLTAIVDQAPNIDGEIGEESEATRKEIKT